MEGGRWKVEGGRWKVEGGRWKVEGGRFYEKRKSIRQLLRLQQFYAINHWPLFPFAPSTSYLQPSSFHLPKKHLCHRIVDLVHLELELVCEFVEAGFKYRVDIRVGQLAAKPAEALFGGVSEVAPGCAADGVK